MFSRLQRAHFVSGSEFSTILTGQTTKSDDHGHFIPILSTEQDTHTLHPFLLAPQPFVRIGMVGADDSSGTSRNEYRRTARRPSDAFVRAMFSLDSIL